MRKKDKIKNDLFDAMDSITNSEEFDSLSSEDKIIRVRSVKKELTDFHYLLILKNHILDFDRLFSMLETYIYFNETQRVNYLYWMLNNYYPDTLSSKLEESVQEEKYELCAVFKNLRSITEMPTVK